MIPLNRRTLLKNAPIIIAALAFLAAAWQAYVANDTEKRTLRAYVGIHQGAVMGLEDDGPIGVGFYFINHGQTPAQKFNFTGTIDVLPYPLRLEYALVSSPKRPKQDGILFPNETPPLTGWVWERNKIDAGTKKEILSANPQREIYAHGIATYKDVFGSEWHTELCIFLNPTSIERDAAGQFIRDKDGHVKFQFAPCLGYNRLY